MSATPTAKTMLTSATSSVMHMVMGNLILILLMTTIDLQLINYVNRNGGPQIFSGAAEELIFKVTIQTYHSLRRSLCTVLFTLLWNSKFLKDK